MTNMFILIKPRQWTFFPCELALIFLAKLEPNLFWKWHHLLHPLFSSCIAKQTKKGWRLERIYTSCKRKINVLQGWTKTLINSFSTLKMIRTNWCDLLKQTKKKRKKWHFLTKSGYQNSAYIHAYSLLD